MPDEIDGSLGSDVLSQLGGIRIDYGSSRLLISGSEPSSGFTIGRPGGTVLHLPRELTSGHHDFSTPVTVVRTGTSGVILLAPVSVNGHAEQFMVDTGSTVGVIDLNAEKQLANEGKITTNGPDQAAGLFCNYATYDVEGLNVRVGGARTRHGPLLIGPASHTQFQGVLGADTLTAQNAPGSWVLLDYRDGYLVVGSN
jgi:hypothetical protein